MDGSDPARRVSRLLSVQQPAAGPDEQTGRQTCLGCWLADDAAAAAARGLVMCGIGAFFFVVMSFMFSNLSGIEIFIHERRIFIHEKASGYYR